MGHVADSFRACATLMLELAHYHEMLTDSSRFLLLHSSFNQSLLLRKTIGRIASSKSSFHRVIALAPAGGPPVPFFSKLLAHRSIFFPIPTSNSSHSTINAAPTINAASTAGVIVLVLPTVASSITPFPPQAHRRRRLNHAAAAVYIAAATDLHHAATSSTQQLQSPSLLPPVSTTPPLQSPARRLNDEAVNQKSQINAAFVGNPPSPPRLCSSNRAVRELGAVLILGSLLYGYKKVEEASVGRIYNLCVHKEWHLVTCVSLANLKHKGASSKKTL
ncbi:unnamed protein product [Urochloa humidicola]